jgi:hypothetical protein
VIGIINKFLDLNWEVYLKFENILYFGFIVKKTLIKFVFERNFSLVVIKIGEEKSHCLFLFYFCNY